MLHICWKKRNQLFSRILSARILITKASYFVQWKNLQVESKLLCFSDYTDKSALANDIGKYFVQKIGRLREELEQGYIPNDQGYVLDDTDVNIDSPIPPTPIEAFELLAEDDVRVLINFLLPRSHTRALTEVL